MGLMFLNLDDGQWDGGDSDESPNYRNPRGVLLDYMEYIVIYDFMYILDSPIPSEISSDEASKRPTRNKLFGSRSSILSSDDVDLKKLDLQVPETPRQAHRGKYPRRFRGRPGATLLQISVIPPRDIFYFVTDYYDVLGVARDC